MLTTRGAITTNVALVECAAGQNKADRNVFLLSELEKVWVAVAVVARRLLLEGSTAQVSPFGSFWTEEYVLLRDRQQRPYTTRKLCFGINQTYASRYGVDTGKVPIEKRAGAGSVRISMADIVAVCGVPAQTASAALKEFFLYLGEGLSRGRVFHLSLPGVATIAMKQQKVVLTMNDDLRQALYDIDSRKWAVELRAEGQQALNAIAATPASGFVSAASSRPSTARVSRASWRAPPAAAANPQDRTDGKKAVFIAAAPSGRTFDEIAQQEEQRRRAAQQVAETDREMRRRQEDLDRRIQHYYAYGDGCVEYHADPMGGDVYDAEYEAHEVVGVEDGHHRSLQRPQSASGESIYNILASGEGQRGGPAHQHSRRPRPQAAGENSSNIPRRETEPEVEVIEMAVEDDESNYEEEGRTVERRPLAHKDAELERVLREEEPFSRPISRRTYHETCAARDLIYSQPYEAPERGSSSAGPSPVYRPSRTAHSDAETTAAAVAQPVAAPRDVSQQEASFRFGRKRFDDRFQENDHVGSLLQYRT